MAACEDEVYVVYDRLTSLKKKLMDPSEGRPCFDPSETEDLPPLYESVNSKDSDGTKSPCSNINRPLVPYKAFFYFFYGAIGSLFPFLALYFRHLWLSPTQTGLLVGLRPIVQSLFGPFWALFSDKFNAKKVVLFIGLCGWLFTHCSILLVPAGKKPLSCMEDTNNVVKRSADFRYTFHDNISPEGLNKYPRNSYDYDNPVSSIKLSNQAENDDEERLPRSSLQVQSLSGNQEDQANVSSNNTDQPKLTKINNSNMDSRDNDINSWWNLSNDKVPIDTWHAFTYLFLIIFIGNIFAAPAQTMANTATLQILGTETHQYGAQRCFGSIGWGVSAFAIGILVSFNHDSSLACKGLDDVNYSPCFFAFGIMMLLALVTATFFKFRNATDVHPHKNQPLRAVCQQLDCLTLFIFFVTFIAGFNMGFIQTFLFWHLQSLGGTQLLFSLITGFNAVGEMIGFLLSVKLISKFGHLKVLTLGIFAYSIRLTVYGVVGNPWVVLTVEFLKCFTSSAVWASVMSYVGSSSQQGATLPGLVHMLYWGAGYGGGGILGGVLMEAVGARITFLGLAILSLALVIVVLVIVRVDCCPKRKQDIYLPVESEDEDEGEEEESE